LIFCFLFWTRYIYDAIASIEYKRKSRIIFGLYNGRTLGYQKIGGFWVFYKEYIDHKKPVYTMQSCSRRGIVAVSGDPKQIVLVQETGEKEPIYVKDSMKKASIEKKRVIYMEFIDNILMYACNDGSFGVCNIYT
jgi:hypothetical protein